MMRIRDNVKEFKRLDKEVELLEEENEQKKWRMAELAWEATHGERAITQTDYAQRVDRSQSHISQLSRTWATYQHADNRPRFADAYSQVQTSGRAQTTQERRQQEQETMVEARKEQREIEEKADLAQKRRAPLLIHAHDFNHLNVQLIRVQRLFATVLESIKELNLNEEEKSMIRREHEAIKAVSDWLDSYLDSNAQDFDSEIEKLLER